MASKKLAAVSPKNPLGLIAIFVGAVEAILGTTAYALGPGELQIFLVHSMVYAFFGVCILSFIVIIFWPAHLYSPEQYSADTAHSVFTGKERDIPRVDPRGQKK